MSSSDSDDPQNSAAAKATLLCEEANSILQPTEVQHDDTASGEEEEAKTGESGKEEVEDVEAVESPEQLQKAHDLFQQALKEDVNCLEAHLGLVYIYGLIEELELGW